MTFFPGGALSSGGQMTKFPTQPGIELDFYGNPVAGGGLNQPWVYVTGLDPTGATDNTAKIQAAEAQLPAIGGGLAFGPGLFACNWTPNAKVLRVFGMGQDENTSNEGTVFLPIPGGGQTAVITPKNTCTFENLEVNGTAIDATTSQHVVNAVGGTGTNAYDIKISNCHLVGGSIDCLNLDTTAQRFHLHQTRTSGAINWAAVDGIITGCVLGGGTKTLTGSLVVAGCHITGNTLLSGLANTILAGPCYFSACYFDSSDSSSPGLITHQNGAGPCIFSGCYFFQNSNGTGPVINELSNATGPSVVMGNCVVTKGTGTFSNLVDNPSTRTNVTNVLITGASLTGNVYGTGVPGVSDGVNYSGVIQPRVPPISFILPIYMGVFGTLAAATVPSAFVPLDANMTATLISVHAVIQLGTSVVGDLQVNGVDVPGLNAMSITTTGQTFLASPALTLNGGDSIHIVLSSLVGSPSGLGLVVQVRYTAG